MIPTIFVATEEAAVCAAGVASTIPTQCCDAMRYHALYIHAMGNFLRNFLRNRIDIPQEIKPEKMTDMQMM